MRARNEGGDIVRSVISAIISALKAAVGVGAKLVSWPLRCLHFGTGGAAPIDVPEVAPALESVPEPAVDHTEIYKRTAVALQSWAAESLLADELQPVPTAWPRSVQEWARGLSRDEAFAIIDAPEHAVIAHISGVFAMPRVRAVQPLRAAKWERAEPLDPARMSAGFASIAAAVPEPS
jgi:hypothetical protein